MSKECPEIAVYKYYWHGKGVNLSCKRHVHQVVNVANAIGLDLHVEAILLRDIDNDVMCDHLVKEE